MRELRFLSTYIDFSPPEEMNLVFLVLLPILVHMQGGAGNLLGVRLYYTYRKLHGTLGHDLLGRLHLHLSNISIQIESSFFVFQYKLISQWKHHAHVFDEIF